MIKVDLPNPRAVAGVLNNRFVNTAERTRTRTNCMVCWLHKGKKSEYLTNFCE